MILKILDIFNSLFYLWASPSRCPKVVVAGVVSITWRHLYFVFCNISFPANFTTAHFRQFHPVQRMGTNIVIEWMNIHTTLNPEEITWFQSPNTVSGLGHRRVWRHGKWGRWTERHACSVSIPIGYLVSPSAYRSTLPSGIIQQKAYLLFMVQTSAVSCYRNFT